MRTFAGSTRPGGRRAAVVAAVVALWCAAIVPAQGVIDERDRLLLGEPAGQPLAGQALHEATEAVTGLMRCPVCQGLSVADSHTPSAIAMKAKAEALLAAGYSRAQVLTFFESSYGEFIRLAPRAEGFNLVVWILPAVGLLVGLFVVWLRIRARPRAAAEKVAPDAELDAYRRRVREEIGR